MSLLAATWIGTAATVGLLVAAVATAVFAMRAFREQSVEVLLLQEQARRDVEQRRRAQASRVFVWVEERIFGDDPSDMRTAACIQNSSAQPVYDMLLGIDDSGEERKQVLMPGGELVMPGLGSAFASGQRPVWVTFRDSAGVR